MVVMKILFMTNLTFKKNSGSNSSSTQIEIKWTFNILIVLEEKNYACIIRKTDFKLENVFIQNFHN